MQNYILKSRMYREELLRWLLILALTLWAVTSTVAYLSVKPQTVVIGVSDDTSYLITEENKARDLKEKVSFLKRFLETYYAFDSKNYSDRMTESGDLMTEDLWSAKQQEILKIKSSLATDPYVQSIRIQSIDELSDGKLEARAEITVQRKIQTEKVPIKITMRIEKRKRSSESPWAYQVVEVSDATL